MRAKQLRIVEQPSLTGARLVLGFSGWMNGGSVSTGTVDYLIERSGARDIADIEPSDFYIYNFPGSMDISEMYRPQARIEDGLIQEFHEPSSTFYCDEEQNLLLFNGREPNMRWKEYGDCIFEVADLFNVEMICFVGSVAGLVPHTREPMFYSSATDEDVRDLMVENGLNPTNYQGPSSFLTYLVTRAREHGLQMSTIVAGIPAYVQEKNVKCICAAAQKLAAILDMSIDLEDLVEDAAAFDARVSEIVAKRPELAKHVRRLEREYDSEISLDGDDPGDLREWFEKQDIRLI